MKIIDLMITLFAAVGIMGTAVAGTSTSNEFRVDTRTGDRVSAGMEELTFSNLWDGDADATVTIAQDGAAIFEGLSGEGEKTWTVDRNGRYELTHATYANGVVAKVETAVFVVDGKEQPISASEITGLTAKQRYPWNGLVDIECDIAYGDADADLFVTVVATNTVTGAAIPVRTLYEADGETAMSTVKAGHCAFVWDVGADIPETKIEDVAIVADVEIWQGGVQLWEGGPYWAECNVGAEKPEEYGYYFWWGDTVGYKREGNSWNAVDGSKTGFSFDPNNCPTYYKSNSELQSLGYIDGSDNLAAAHDAATVHLGAPWRMPTAEEWDMLISNCDTEWTTCNGVNGRLVKGRGAYASKSIFLPAAGYGYGSDPNNLGSYGHYWSSSSPHSDFLGYVWDLSFNSGFFDGSYNYINRYIGRSVRPLRVFATSFPTAESPAVSTHMSLDTRTVREPAASETITYNPAWGDGDSVTIALDGETIGTFAEAGEIALNTTGWSGGVHALTHTSGDGVLTAQYVTSLPIPIEDVSEFSYSGVYDGKGHGIDVKVAGAPSGMTIKYSPGQPDKVPGGTWSTESPLFTNVCGQTTVWYAIECMGYVPYTNNATVTITPKELTTDLIWLVLPLEDYVYDGNAKEPGVSAVDGDPPIITDADWDVSYTDNVNAGTATATFTGKGNYYGEVTETFEILKADNEWTTEPSIADWTYGEAASTPVSAAKVGTAAVTYSSGSVPTMPGDYTATFTVAESVNHNELTKTVPFKVLPAEIALVADGTTGEYNGKGYGINVSVSKPASGYTVEYAESADGPWTGDVKYVDVCTGKPIHYRVTAPGYAAKTGSATVTITPKELTTDIIWLVLPLEDYVYDGNAKEPGVSAVDGDPPIITDADWDVSYTDNVNAGTATATFTGKGNYTGTCEETFPISPRDISNVVVAPIPDQEHTGTPIKPAIEVSDGNPSIISEEDYLVEFIDNVDEGSATVKLTGRRNYTGSTSVQFEIVSSEADTALLDASISWKYLKATGTYFAHLEVVCTNGFDKGLASARFLFADRKGNDGVVFASLWDTRKRAANANVENVGGMDYRYVDIDVSRIAGQDIPSVYGVAEMEATTIPTAERTIEMYVRKRVEPSTGNEVVADVNDFVGYLQWVSNDITNTIPIVAEGTAKALKKMDLRSTLPIGVKSLNTSLAVGLPINAKSHAVCRITEFRADGDTISGKVEVGAEKGSRQLTGTLGENGRLLLYGAKSLGGDYELIGEAYGEFSFDNKKDFRFFKSEVKVDEILQ